MRVLALVLVYFAAAPSIRAQSDGPRAVGNEVTTVFLPEQDTAFQQAKRASVTARVRFADHVRQTSAQLAVSQALSKPPSAWENAVTNLASIPPELLAPRPEELMQYQVAIRNAQYVPGVLLFPMGTGNLMVGLSDIGQLLGITEDVSPHLAYTVPSPSEVRIVIYSTGAQQVRTLYHGLQRSGSFEIDWDGKNDDGHYVGKGDYIAEIYVGEHYIIRKRIVLP